MIFCLPGRILSSLASALVLLIGIGCDAGGTPTSAPTAASKPAPTVQRAAVGHDLTLYGYNYTDTEIGSFEVNGQGGGNVEVSIPEAGGGKSVCCITVVSPLQQAMPVKIKWTRDSETWCEQFVELKPPLPTNPKYLEVHFYPDGHLEVAVTEVASTPRLVLQRTSRAGRHAKESANLNHDSKYARCEIGYR
jgi:hypothetical protein